LINIKNLANYFKPDFFISAPGMGGNSVVKVHYGGWQTPTISLRQGCLP